MSWQLALVVLIEVLAVGYLLFKMFPIRRKPRVLQRPDVKVSSLVRKRPPEAGSPPRRSSESDASEGPSGQS